MGCTACNQTYWMVAAIFCTETSRHVNYSVSNQHWISSSKPLQWIQCAEQIYIYSGFTFSHYDLPFPTRYCIPFVRSGLYQLVICVKGIRVCALHCVCAWPRFALHFGFVHRRGHHAFRESRVLHRQSTDHVGYFCCRAIVKLFCCC